MKVHKKSEAFTSFDIGQSIEADEINNAIEEVTSTKYVVKDIPIEDIEFNPKNTRFNDEDKHFDLLTENGYITIQTAEGFKNKNIYVINEYVNKVNCGLTDNDCSESTFVVEGIKTYGYGTIPKLIMIDKRLTIKAKALMAFLLSLSGAGRCAFPRRDTICMHLGVSKNTYVSMMNELIFYGYIKVKQRRTRNGTFAINDYHFTINPVAKDSYADSKIVNVENTVDVDKNVDICERKEKSANTIENTDANSDKNTGSITAMTPCTKKYTFPENGLNSEFTPCTKKCTFLENDRVPKNTPLPCTQNCTNNNINSNNNNVLLCTSILHPGNKVISDKMPNGNDLKQSLHIISEYEYYRKFSDTYAQKHCRIVDILIGIFSEKVLIHKEEHLGTGELWRRFAHILNNNYYLQNAPCVDFIYDVLIYYKQCESMYRIEYPARYIRTLIIDKIINDYDFSLLT